MIPYHQHLKSPYWKEVAEFVKKRDGYRCKLCNSPKLLQVHHRCYDHVGNEMEHTEDLVTLCGGCHHMFHEMSKRNLFGTDYEMVMIDNQNHRRITYCSDSIKWMNANGINPKISGWKQRCIGRMFPMIWVEGSFDRKERQDRVKSKQKKK